MALVIVSIAVLALLTVWILGGVRIVRPHERGMVERLGRYRATVDPGLRMIVPVVDTLRLVDLREQVLDVAAADVMTKDKVAIAVDAAVFYAATDPEDLVYQVADLPTALDALAQTGLRTAVGELPLDEAMAGRDDIAMALRTNLDDTTGSWGVAVRRVEVKRVEPPADVLAALHEQAIAERLRAATVARAEGERQAAVAQAEGERQARLLRAEADRDARALAAEADAAAVKVLYQAIRDSRPAPDEVAARAVEVLRELAHAAGPLTLVLPPDLSGWAASLGGARAAAPWPAPADPTRAGAPRAEPLPPPAPRPVPRPHERRRPVGAAPLP